MRQIDDEELKVLIHEISQETMKALESRFASAFLETYDSRYYFAEQAIKECREEAEYNFRPLQQGGDLTSTLQPVD